MNPQMEEKLVMTITVLSV